MIKSLLIVGLGSFCGGALRYYISTLMKSACGQGFPWGTLSVNLVGCLLIGLLLGIFSRCGVQSNSWSLLLTVGFCGDLKFGRTVHSLIGALSRYKNIKIVLDNYIETQKNNLLDGAETNTLTYDTALTALQNQAVEIAQEHGLPLVSELQQVWQNDVQYDLNDPSAKIIVKDMLRALRSFVLYHFAL